MAKQISEPSSSQSEHDSQSRVQWSEATEASPKTNADEPFPEGIPPQSSQSGLLSGRKGVFIGLGLGLAIAAVGNHFLQRPQQVSSAKASPATATQLGQSVQAETVFLSMVQQTFPTQGTVEARNWVSVMPRLTGVQVKEIRVDEGQPVEAGQVIAVLDNSLQRDRLDQAIAQVASAKAQLQSTQTQIATSQAQLQSAQAQLNSARAGVEQKQARYAQQQAALAEAKSNLRRYEDLEREGGISRQELDARRTTAITAQEGLRVAQTDIKSAQAVVGQAEATVSGALAGIHQAQSAIQQQKAEVDNAIARVQELKTQQDQATFVKAPAPGIVAKKTVNVGDLTGTTPLFLIEEKGALELQAKVPETLLPKVRIGATTQIASDADPNLKLVGRVREITPVVDAKSRQATVKIDLPPQVHLKPGMFLKAAIAFNTTEAITVPTVSVISQLDGQKTVFVLQDNRVKARLIEIGELSQGRLIVKTGLNPGEQVVTVGAGFLKDGDRVHVVP